MVEGRPIPAIFLYKDPQGSKYSYNILDGKQRLESLMLFVGDKRADINIPQWRKHFFQPSHQKHGNFVVKLNSGAVSFRDLDEAVVRDFMEYAIPTIEINLTAETTLDEIISLFVDINQYGEKVRRFDIVKALAKNPLLDSVWHLVAEKQMRGKDVFYRQKRSPFTKVLKTLQVVDNIVETNAQTDRIWERLLEIALYARTNKHVAPTQILKGFISGTGDKEKLSVLETKKLREVFNFLSSAYADKAISGARLAKDQTHFYTMVTSIMGASLLATYGANDLKRRLKAFAVALDSPTQLPDKKLAKSMQAYMEEAKTQTTHINRREKRQDLFIGLIEAL